MVSAVGSEPLGAYIRALRTRKRPKMSQKKLAGLAKTTSNTIWRIEAGVQEPQESLAAILTAVGGRIKDIPKLLADDASIDLARELAEQAIIERDLLDWADADENRAKLLRRIRAMSADDPDLRSRIDGYLDKLQDH